eukprot:6467885-Lingulodinium_polyedra.AAC.1
MAEGLMLKVTQAQWPGDAVRILGKKKCRDEAGFTTKPDPKHVVNVLRCSGVDGRASGKGESTPGVPRSPNNEEEEKELDPEHVALF